MSYVQTTICRLTGQRWSRQRMTAPRYVRPNREEIWSAVSMQPTFVHWTIPFSIGQFAYALGTPPFRVPPFHVSRQPRCYVLVNEFHDLIDALHVHLSLSTRKRNLKKPKKKKSNKKWNSKNHFWHKKTGYIIVAMRIYNIISFSW